MHIAALNPAYISRDEVSADEVEHERKILTEQALNEGKPENIVAKMVEGRLGKYFEEVCVLDQSFVKNPDQKVKVFVESTGGKLVSFTRYAVGEGIEKREDNFAEEVMSQVKGNNIRKAQAPTQAPTSVGRMTVKASFAFIRHSETTRGARR